MRQARSPKRGVDRSFDRPDPQQRQPKDRERWAVGKHHADHLASPHTGGQQAVGEPVHLAVELGKGQRAARHPEQVAARELGRARGQVLRQGQRLRAAHLSS